MQIDTNPHLMQGLGALNRTSAAGTAASAGKIGEIAEKGWKTLEKGVDDLVGVGGEMAIPDEALRKDDALGRLVTRAFGI